MKKIKMQIKSYNIHGKPSMFHLYCGLILFQIYNFCWLLLKFNMPRNIQVEIYNQYLLPLTRLITRRNRWRNGSTRKKVIVNCINNWLPSWKFIDLTLYPQWNHTGSNLKYFYSTIITRFLKYVKNTKAKTTTLVTTDTKAFPQKKTQYCRVFYDKNLRITAPETVPSTVLYPDCLFSGTRPILL